MRKSGKICSYFQNKLIEEVEKMIDEEIEVKWIINNYLNDKINNKLIKISHKDISNKIEKYLNNETEAKVIQKKYNLDRLFIDFAYNPIIQSGGDYDLRYNFKNNNNL